MEHPAWLRPHLRLQPARNGQQEAQDQRMAQYRVTVDTGGTFSDFVYVDDETRSISVAKIPSTPDDPSRAILAGVELLLQKGIDPKDVRYFCHGTTVGTNALLEGKGVRTGLLVTEG